VSRPVRQAARPRIVAELADNRPNAKAARATKRVALANLLSDENWHTTGDLLRAGGAAYTSRTAELRDAGWEIECEHVARGEWRYRAVTTGGYKPPRFKLGKQALEAVVTTLGLVADQDERVFAAVYDQLPEPWLDDIESREAWQRAGLL
jgi:hypothetical protein